MTSPELVYFIGFFLVCSFLMALAFYPAWQEWRNPTDCQPLPVVRSYTNDVGHFAEKFRAVTTSKIAGEALTENDWFEFVPARIEDMDWAHAQRPLIAMDSIASGAQIRCGPPLFVRGDIDTSERGSFSAVLADGAITLGNDSEIRKWAHAEGPVKFGTSCFALRRISSATEVELSTGCCFERINAPVVRFGAADADVAYAAASELAEASFADLPGALRRTDSLYMVKGDCNLPSGRLYRGSLVVTGHLSIGAGTRIVGDVKARKGAVVGARAIVLGALVSEEKIQLLDDTLVSGPVVSETDIIISAHARIGTSHLPTTVTADHIIAEVGAVAHGTVWARELGIVWSI